MYVEELCLGRHGKGEQRSEVDVPMSIHSWESEVNTE